MYINNFLETSIAKRKYNKVIKKELDKYGCEFCYFDGWYYYYYDTYSIRNIIDGIPFYKRVLSAVVEIFYYIHRAIVG